MGVYNPKKKMPTSCYMCWDNLYCEYKIKNHVKSAQGRADDCPLIELEEWNSYSNGKMYAPKGTFQNILDDERRAER